MRDRRGRSPSPRPIGEALSGFRREVAPRTMLADAQTAWERAVGPQLAAVTSVSSESEGVLTVECESTVWSQELDLLEPRLREALALEMEGEAPRQIRFRAVS